MSYSSIKKRSCKCGCGKMPTISCAGYNYVCAPAEIKEKLGTRRQLNQKNRNKRLAQGRKLHQEQDALNFIELNAWFKKIAMEYGAPNGCACWECGAWIPFTYMRAATAHIFAKSIFKSVSTHPDNFLILGAACCHDKTHRLDTFSKMKIFPEAVRRVREFEPLIKERHKYLTQFQEYANKIK